MAAACGTDPAPPAGYTIFKGKAPPPLSAWAVSLLKTVNKYDFGQTWTTEYNGHTYLARIDHHTWHYLPDGTLLTGICWKGITLYAPVASGFADATASSLVTPNPSYAVYDTVPPAATDWGLVAVSVGALGLVIVGFAAALRFAGKAA